MDTASLLVGIVGGGTAAALVTSRHAAAERTRERLLTTAEAFLAASDRARGAVSTTARWMSELTDASAALDRHLTKLSQGDGNTEEQEELLATQQLRPLPARALGVFEDAISEMVAGISMPSRWQAELDEIIAAADGILADTDVADSQSDFPQLVRSLVTRVHRAAASLRECYASLDDLVHTLPRVRLTFSVGADDDPVTFAAFRIAAHAASAGVLIGAHNENVTPASDLQEMTAWQGEFARRVAARLHPWRTASLGRIRPLPTMNAEPTGSERLEAVRASEQLQLTGQASSSTHS